MAEPLVEPWYFRRPALAAHLLTLLLDGPGDPLALVGERRIGKTSHLLLEVLPAARARGLLGVYVDIFQHRSDPLAAINYALQEAIDDLIVPASAPGRRLKTAVKKVGAASFSLELGDEPVRRRPEDPFLLVDWLLKTLLRAARRPVLLVFDEIQELATAAHGEPVISALRSAITKSRSQVRVIFTGSSQEKLLELFSRSRAALYEGASTLPFPHLGADFIAFMAAQCRQRFRKRMPAHELASAFERLQRQPRALIDLVLLHASGDAEELADTLEAHVQAQLTGGRYEALWVQLKPLQQRICERVARGDDVTSLAARQAYANGSDRAQTPPGTVHDALRTLLATHLLNKAAGGRGAYRIDDPLFALWLQQPRTPGAQRRASHAHRGA